MQGISIYFCIRIILLDIYNRLSYIFTLINSKLRKKAKGDNMPHHKSAAKRLKKSKVENAYNRHYRTMMRTALKKVKTSATKEDGAKNLIAAQSILDKLVIKGIIKKNNASNKKSRLSKFLNKIEQEKK